MSICPRCNSERSLVYGNDPAPFVRCADCHHSYVPQHGPASHETLKEIREAMERIEAKLDRMMEREGETG